MARLDHTETRHTALSAVYRDAVRYHDGLAGPALGYTWAEGAGGQMSEDMRHTLRELWAADLITVDTQRILAQRGRRVSITTGGYLCLQKWEAAILPAAA